ncbi:DNA-binding response regulator [Actinoplanes sp. NBRC 14428]|uniref:LuxR family two component transcriptional regulator n=1 Tax=Pseudosporangium ferrugineum TaxID=439699 RepID=A0A2T0RHH6_9ACTN|nr:LuxR family two component transcriptional regulator [Pseudosporangium ferrugineum]BCJ51394.1 DNA-binding response regulator [Actinoplanes sp. NBRC 14428]
MHADRPLRIALAEDSVLLREGLVALLQRFGHSVVVTAGDAEQLLRGVEDSDPDLVISDVRMPPAFSDEGLRAAIALRRLRPGLPVLVLSQYVQQTYAAELFGSDAEGLGYLLKDRVGRIAEFTDAVARVAAGGTVVDPEVVRQMLDRRRNPLHRLTTREREVLALMAEGRSNTEITRRLTITDAAVAKHIGNVFLKLDLPPTEEGHRRVLAVLAFLREP